MEIFEKGKLLQTPQSLAEEVFSPEIRTWLKKFMENSIFLLKNYQE